MMGGYDNLSDFPLDPGDRRPVTKAISIDTDGNPGKPVVAHTCLC